MFNFLHKAKILFGIFLAVTLVSSTGVMNTAFAVDDLTVRNPEDVTLPDGVVLSKTAQAVDGKVNSWDVTLRVEMPWASTTSDTVIVIDKSWSMAKNGSGKMRKAKVAAKSLAKQLLTESNTVNRVALVSFEYYTTVHKFDDGAFSTNYADVASTIDGLRADGGTFTQAAIRDAAGLLADSDADIKNIVLLSDGVPTQNYFMYHPDDYLVDGGPGKSEYEKQTSETVPESAFNYDTYGGARNEMWYEYGDVKIGESSRGTAYYEQHYYNSGNCAIAEAGYYKGNVNGELYTVALDMNEAGNAVLAKIASPGKAYVANEDDLSAIFEQIGGRIISDVSKPAMVNDIMGGGIIMSNESATDETEAEFIEWTPEFIYDVDRDKYVAETMYRVEANEDILKYADEEGFAPLNKIATITYGFGKNAEFPVPMVKPVFEKTNWGVLNPEEGYGQAGPEMAAKTPDTGNSGHTNQNERNYAGVSIAAVVAMTLIAMLTVEIAVFRKRR